MAFTVPLKLWAPDNCFLPFNLMMLPMCSMAIADLHTGKKGSTSQRLGGSVCFFCTLELISIGAFPGVWRQRL
ncbi:hypothetical protein C8J57DRAFT_1282374, partial [Mycena rebaudengoi]